MSLPLATCKKVLAEERLPLGGTLLRVNGSTLHARLRSTQTGAIVRIPGREDRRDLLAEVIGFAENEAILAPFEEPRGVGPGDAVVPEGRTDHQTVSPAMVGRVIDALGRPMDGGSLPEGHTHLPLIRPAPNPLERARVDQRMHTGISAIDVPCAVGRGQRVGLFAGAGVGKSSLLGMLARHSDADVNVVALIGERGREVRAFLEDELQEEGRARSVVVVATGDVSPILRIRACFVATTLAEYFRDQGKNVLFLMDSLTRYAHAAREVGLAAGEPPTTRGYPPSVFSGMPRLLERAGNGAGPGSMTAFYTVLVDGDDMTEPVADAARSILDGHLVLSRRIAEAGRYPAVDVSASLSRLAQELAETEHQEVNRELRSILAAYEEVRDLIQVGAYRAGTDPEVDRVVKLKPRIDHFFRQEKAARRELDSDLAGLQALLGEP